MQYTTTIEPVAKIAVPRTERCRSRLELWQNILDQIKPETVAEIGVWKGEFAAHLLSKCPSIKKYYLLDPWRTLYDWNKPRNVDEQAFAEVFREAMNATRFAQDKIVVLRGSTLE